ncbi:hypothetical protein [Nonomuraea endophytica]|uniref:Uncharacterized protein n=1 Tax=Nonomuraea endophytica TaxID=714136 RepID=A0A7W8A1P5_9ACTN|nr:hypothetical protein [Nonomuraea endophytica]MBB5077880.1 hypothetical protein [Nonomuraea endophytica]
MPAKQPSVFVCPLSPPGNHLPMRVEAGERALVYNWTQKASRNTVSQDLKDKAVTYLRSLEKADWDTARAMCARTATVWHNDGKGESPIEEYANFVPAGQDG